MSLSPLLRPALPLLVLLTLALPPCDTQAAEDPGFGSELSLFEEIPSVFGASKYEQKVSEAPSSVSIVTAAEIQRYGYRTLADILRSVRGFHVNNDHNYEYVAVRGIGRPGDYNTRLLVMVDGHRINENIFGLAGIGRDFLLDVDLIERVEVIRGPSSSLYGTGAFFGVVNVITRRAEQLDGVELSAAAAAYDSYGGRLSYGHKFGRGAEALVSGSLYSSNGDNWSFPEYDDTARNLDGEEARNLYMNFAHGPFTLSGALAKREKDVPTAPFETTFNSRTRTTDERGYLDLAYAQTLTDNLDVSGRVFFDSYRYDGEYPYLPDIFRDYAYGEWLGIEAQSGYRAGRQHLIAGGEFRESYREDQGAYIDPLAPDFIDHRHSSYWALFLQDEIELADWARLNVGLRHDDYSTFGGATNPRAALIFTPMASTNLKLLYGAAFRAPNNYELFYSDNDIQKANPNLEPEEIVTYEAILEHYFTADVRGLIGVFHNKTENLIEQVEDPIDLKLFYQNRGEVKARGIEAELEAKLVSGVTGRASYTYQEAIDKATDSRLTNSPLHLAKLNLTLPLLREQLFLGVEEQFTSSRKTNPDGGKVGSFAVTNLTLSANRIVGGLDFQVSVFNLFDREYADPAGEEHAPLAGIPQHGRSGRVELTYAF